ncbi:MAG TPA: YqcC family protein [Pseudohaliea sp.]|nr:YqcC family protein [Pseudohaliea sp.]HKL63311.1 YqcC family protein [Woeseiaceae bacterium]
MPGLVITVRSANHTRAAGIRLCQNASMDGFHQAVAEVVDGIEAEMKRTELWDAERPTLSRLGSPQPFCFDTLRFHQWLQWLFLPRMRRILDADGAGMPSESGIHAYAEECLRDDPRDTDALLALIRRFDELISRSDAGIDTDTDTDTGGPRH